VADILLVSLAAAASFYLRLDAEKIVPYLPTMAVVAVVSVVVKPIVFISLACIAATGAMPVWTTC
jgi:hypothetical protein